VSELTKGLDELCGFYGRKTLDERQVGVWFQKLKWVDSRDFKNAIDETTSWERTFPTPQVILKHAGEARQRRAANEASRDRVQASEFFKPENHSPGIARDSVRLFEALLEFKPGSRDKLEFEVSAYKAMMKKYPMAGWEVNYQDAVKRLNDKLAKDGDSNVMGM